MQVTFSKLYLSSYIADNNLKYWNVGLYYVYEGNELLGRYFRQRKNHFLKFQEQDITIETKGGFFKKPQYSIIDNRNEQLIGSYIMPDHYSDTLNFYTERFYQDSYLKVVLNGSQYDFCRKHPDVEYNLFKVRTWGYYRFEIYDEQDVRRVRYDFRITNPILGNSISYYNELEGTIEAEKDDYLLLFTGCFLLERFFDDNTPEP